MIHSILSIVLPVLLLVSGVLATNNAVKPSSSLYKTQKSTLSRKEFVERYRKLGHDDLYGFPFNQKTYSFVRSLGQGACGVVDLHHVKRGAKGPKNVAVKFIRFSGKNAKSIDTNVREMFKLKAIDHPNVMKFFHGYKDDTGMLIVGEFFEQGSLEMYEVGQAKFGMLPFPRIQRIIKDILSALAYMHSYGMIHRDIKPANIMLAGKGAKLIDFGFCTEPTEEDCDPQDYPRSPYYAAPEVFTQKPHNNAADMWSFGITIWFLFNNPYRNDMKFKNQKEFFDLVIIRRGPWHGRDELPEYLDDFITATVVFDHEGRLGAGKLLSSLTISWV